MNMAKLTTLTCTQTHTSNPRQWLCPSLITIALYNPQNRSEAAFLEDCSISQTTLYPLPSSKIHDLLFNPSVFLYHIVTYNKHTVHSQCCVKTLYCCVLGLLVLRLRVFTQLSIRAPLTVALCFFDCEYRASYDIGFRASWDSELGLPVSCALELS